MCSRFSCSIAVAFVLVACLSALAQKDDGKPAPDSRTTPLPADLSGSSFSRKILPQPVEVTAPFDLNARSATDTKSVEYLSEPEMTAADKDLAAHQESAIRDAAMLAGMDFDQGVWARQQIVCEAMPGHLLLLYASNNGPGDVSLFSASVSRSGNHRVRVIPIMRRGYSLFTPVAVNSLTVTAFNRIREAEPAGAKHDWLSTGLCYAALTGVRPESSELQKSSTQGGLGLSFPPTLEVDSLGGATVRYVDIAAAPEPMQWALSFDAQGKLTSVAEFPTPKYSVQSLPQAAPVQSPAPDAH